jgi:hypothetical protein
MNGLETNSPWQDLLSCARPPAAQGARAADATKRMAADSQTSRWRSVPRDRRKTPGHRAAVSFPNCPARGSCTLPEITNEGAIIS